MRKLSGGSVKYPEYTWYLFEFIDHLTIKSQVDIYRKHLAYESQDIISDYFDVFKLEHPAQFHKIILHLIDICEEIGYDTGLSDDVIRIGKIGLQGNHRL